MKKKYYIGLDIGGTKIEATIIKEIITSTDTSFKVKDRNFETLDRKRIPTQREKGYEYVLDLISKLIVDTCLANSIIVEDVEGIGLGLPGSINPESSIMINGNSNIFIGKDIINDLKKALKFKKEIFVDNDANLFALAETFWGAGAKHFNQTGIAPNDQISIGIILGTGCGGGVIINGKQLIGRNGGGAEIGHTVLVKNGVDCYCKRSGCAEQYLSGTGLELMYERMNSGKKLKGKEIFATYKNEKESREVIESYIEHLSLFITNLTNTFDPDLIVLGGGVSNQSSMYELLNKNNKESSFIPNSSTIIYQNVLGDSAGVLGAALLPILR
jgi:fructokinase